MNKPIKNKVNQIDCTEATKRFNDFMDNYIKGKAREELLQHLEICRHCFERIEFEQLLRSKIRDLGKPSSAGSLQVKKDIENILSKNILS